MRKLTIKILAFLSIVSCNGIGSDPEHVCAESGPVTVGFVIGAATKSAAGADGLSTGWTSGDRLAVWALNSSNAQILSGQPFSLYGADASCGYFTSELDAPMPEGGYTYYLSYPEPLSFNGTSAEYLLPSVQDGRAGNDSDIMFGGPVTGRELTPLDWDSLDHSEFSATLDHATHRLRFYLDDPAYQGRSILKLSAEFPKAVAGNLRYDLADISAGPEIISGVNTLELLPSQPLELSEGGERNYLCASIIPTTFDASDVMKLTMLMDSEVLVCNMPLKGRHMAAGHSTAVKISPEIVYDYTGMLLLKFCSNNLGEDIQYAVFSLDADGLWDGSAGTTTVLAADGTPLQEIGGNTWTYAPEAGIAMGDEIMLLFKDEAAYRALGGRTLSVTYESEHISIPETLVIPDLSSVDYAGLEFNVPWLLDEDFSEVGTLSFDDEYTSSFNSTSKDGYDIVNGWTGARVGASEGLCVRIAARRETSANYPARLDSPPLKGRIKSAVDLELSFDYGADSQEGGISAKEYGQYCNVGYHNTAGALKSGSSTGNYEGGDNEFYIKEKTGSYSYTPHHGSFVLHAVSGEPARIVIRTVSENQAGLNNNTMWLYIDNVKVKVNK